MNKLIEHLQNDIYCRIGVSPINGVGVIAIKDIPEGTNPFKNLSDKKDTIIRLYENDLQEIDSNVVKLVKDFFASNSNGYYDYHDVLYEGPNYINISYYMNHSVNPNVSLTPPSYQYQYYNFITNTFIRKGEELTINYNDYK
jgi:SET domain-containing protein